MLNNQQEKGRFREIFEKAGLKVRDIKEISIGDSIVKRTSPFYAVATQFGTIGIGWEKRECTIMWDNVIETMEYLHGIPPVIRQLFMEYNLEGDALLVKIYYPDEVEQAIFSIGAYLHKFKKEHPIK